VCGQSCTGDIECSTQELIRDSAWVIVVVHGSRVLGALLTYLSASYMPNIFCLD